MGERMLVIGAGAIGGVIAARLIRYGCDVTVVDANPHQVAALTNPGLWFEAPDVAGIHVSFQAVERPDQLSGVFDYGLVTVKSPVLETALRPLAEVGRVDTYVSLGNGLVQERIAEIVTPHRLVVGLVEWGATNLGIARVRQTTLAPIVIGELDDTVSPRLARLRDVLSLTAEVEIACDLTARIWSKLLLNSTFSALGAITGLLYGEIVANALGFQLALALWEEGYEVAVAAGIRPAPLVDIDPEELLAREPVQLPRAASALERLMHRLGATKASMLQDLEHGIATEVDVINGGVVSTGRRVSRSTPLNDGIVSIVHEYENGVGRPSIDALDRLASISAT